VSIEDEDSIERQNEKIRDKAKELGLRVEHIFEDNNVSGGICFEDRPDGQKILTHLKAGDILITARWDRFSRNLTSALLTLLTLHRSGVRIICLEHLGGVYIDMDDPMCVLIITSQLLAADLFLKQHSKKTKEAIAWRKARGLVVRPMRAFGFKRKKIQISAHRWRVIAYEPAPDERETIAEMHRRWKQGESIGKLSDELRRKGIKTAEGMIYYWQPLADRISYYDSCLKSGKPLWAMPQLPLNRFSNGQFK